MTKMNKMLGVDYGLARTGLAVSDALGFMANGIGAIKSRDTDFVVDEICRYAREYDVSKIVVGNPVNMNGTVGDKSENVHYLAEKLRDKSGLTVVLFDERCTTMAAHQILNETDTRGKKRKNVVDTLSAEIILQNYMDYLKNNKL